MTTTTTAVAARTTTRLPRTFTDSARMLTVLAALVIVFSVATDRFWSLRTAQYVAGQIPTLLIAAVGMTYVLVLGSIDLSVGSILALGSAVLGVTMVGGWPLPLALAACVATGVALGAANALIMIRWRLPSFIVTLGMLEVARGGTFLAMQSRTQYVGARIEALNDVALFGVPAPFLFAIAIVVVAHIVLVRTVFGRHLVATGTNEETVRLTGIDTRKAKLVAFAVSGGLAGIAAIVHTARLSAADPNAGIGFELQAIAAVVIGGTSLMGGRGSVVGTLFGVLVIAVLDTGLAQIGAQEPVKRLVTGVVIVLAVIVDNVRHRRRAS